MLCMTKKKYPGYLLVANPNNPRDELSKGVLLCVNHAGNLAIGLQINNPLEDIDLQHVADNLGMESSVNAPLWFGGNISQNKIHVVHSNDWRGLSTVKMNDEISVTNDISVLAAIARGEGPRYYRACAGYWLWDDGRMDRMLNPRAKDEPIKWEIAPATLESIFDSEGPDQWRAVLDKAAKYQVDAWF
jgi:putative transcriptional regulator